MQTAGLLAAWAAFGPAASYAASSITLGDTRVTALSPTLLRVEPKGPKGFEDRDTFNVVGRKTFPGLEISVMNNSSAGTWLETSAYRVFVPAGEQPSPGDMCSGQPQQDTDAEKPTRSPSYPDGLKVDSAEACCAACAADPACVAYTVGVAVTPAQKVFCWPFSAVGGTRSAANKTFANVRGPQVPHVVVTSPAGQVLFTGSTPGKYSEVQPNLLHWPSPPCNGAGCNASQPAYFFTDRPRFTAPKWGPTPIPQNESVPPELAPTNGFDFTNDVDGDTYIFLLGTGLEEWWSARREFLALTGPTPLLPDYAYGVWYTWYVVYTEQRAKHEIGNWTKINLPLDVWGLDMNWRNVGIGQGSSTASPESVQTCREQNATGALPGCRSHFYDSPNLDLLPGLASPDGPGHGTNEWFEYLKSLKLRTYFNDHPFPVANQTTPEEVAFRYKGLQEWIGRGLSYWWFDHNWAFTVPGPRMPYDTKDSYEGMSGQVWGSQVYYESTRVAYEQHGITDRPIALSRDNGPNWRADDAQAQCLGGAGSPAHHRFPVWWTGDGVPLMASVNSMVEEAVHDFRAFVHSDCGGHGSCSSVDPPRTPGQPPPPPPENKPCESPTNAALLRWTAHCTFGTVVRFHQGDHRFWLRDEATQDSARSYLDMRYQLAPSLIAAGRTVQMAGFPLTARADLIWPDYPEANDPSQYIHLNASLVAPLEGDPPDATSRSVWIPPGDWQDGWTGHVVTGPKTMTVTPTESEGKFNIPMWHKRGGVVVLVSDGKQRINDQDWSELTIEGFPESARQWTETRDIFEQDDAGHADDASTTVELSTDGSGRVRVGVSPAAAAAARSWVVRLHLRPGQRLVLSPTEDAAVVDSLRHLEPDCGGDHFPFRGAGAHPACAAGNVAELRLPTLAAERFVTAEIVG